MNERMILFGLAFFLGVLINVIVDSGILLNGGVIKTRGHRLRTLLRTIWLTANASILYGITLNAVSLVILQFAAWWIFFDIFLNISMGWPWNYMGDGKDWYEKFKNWKVQLLVKIITFGIAILITVLTNEI